MVTMLSTKSEFVTPLIENDSRAAFSYFPFYASLSELWLYNSLPFGGSGI